MKQVYVCLRTGAQGVILQGMLLASALVGFFSIISFLVVPISMAPDADIFIDVPSSLITINTTFDVHVRVHSVVPVNVFKGELTFDPNLLSVESIEYNTGIADLWAEKPWYENGAGTINFIGGTTNEGGFTGTGDLITITFRTHAPGVVALRIHEARILKHDGFGTDAVLKEPIDAVFTVGDEKLEAQTIAEPKERATTITVVHEIPSTDLNKDGKQTIADVSIFMLGMFRNSSALDFNDDGSVDSKDLSIIMSAR